MALLICVLIKLDNVILTITILWTNPADDELFLLFLQKIGAVILQRRQFAFFFCGEGGGLGWEWGGYRGECRGIGAGGGGVGGGK